MNARIAPRRSDGRGIVVVLEKTRSVPLRRFMAEDLLAWERTLSIGSRTPHPWLSDEAREARWRAAEMMTGLEA
ncbi:MAG: hypothetical protein ACYDCK_00545 [Thermoplasmatota archaeon]